ncbi:hypothetical protein Hanom_Chr01g00093451 [Helianthus anomalus]
MSSIKEADNCIKYLDCSILDGRVLTVEKLFDFMGEVFVLTEVAFAVCCGSLS